MERVFRFFMFIILFGLMSMGCGLDCWAPQVPFYSQQDPRWSNDQMGTSGLTVGDYGCLITSVTMAYNYYGVRATPGEFNEYLGNVNGGYVNGGLFNWEMISRFSQGKVTHDSINKDQLAGAIDTGYPVLVEVNYGAHWILIVGRSGDNYFVLDPWYLQGGEGRQLSDYGDIEDYVVIKGADAYNSVYDQAVSRNGGKGYVGEIQHTRTFGDHGTHWYHGEWRSDGDDILVQNRKGGEFNGHSGILFDSLHGGRKAYWLRSGFWNTWTDLGGPHSWLGAPINEEYWNGTDADGRGQARQDFRNGYLWWSGSEVTTNYYARATPGWFDDQGWDNSRSYAFAEAYERNGARNYLGEAMNTVHDWNGIEIQDFDWAGYGHCAIIHNSENNDAYLVRSGFWSHYANNNGPSTLGYSCEDEMGRGNTSVQRFQKGTLNYDGSSISVSYKSDHGCGLSTSAGSGGLSYGSGGDDDCQEYEIGGNGIDDNCDGVIDDNDYEA